MTGQTQMIETPAVDAASAIRLFESIEALYPMLVPVHVFPDNAHVHHSPDHSPGVVREWLARPGCRIRLLISEAILARDRGELPKDRPALLPAPEPDRAVIGGHAQKRHPQQMLRHMRTIRGRHARFLARQGPQELEPLPRLRHR
ncbi:MAG: hypothetical protein WBG11_05170 [Methylocella sp.]